VLEADNTEGKSADYTALDVPIATAEKAIAGMRRLVYSGDQMAIKKQAQILDKSAEEIIRQTKIEATKGKAVSNKIIYRKG
jgi:3-hydroxyisobutyrate dehydrogenase-like beta-hydroxyacid dehydrogenase